MHSWLIFVQFNVFVLLYFSSVFDTLDFVHKSGIIYRDLKVGQYIGYRYKKVVDICSTYDPFLDRRN